METIKTIKSALISVFNKEGLESVVRELHKNNVLLYSTGGTLKYIQSLGIEVTAVESLTSYPEILGGRVKTLHPAIFGGILYRRNLQEDVDTVAKFNVPSIDLVIVDLYPFEETLAQQAEELLKKTDVSYYTIPVEYEIKGNFLGYIKFKRSIAKSNKMLNFDKETISIVQNSTTGAIIAEGELTIVGIPDEFF